MAGPPSPLGFARGDGVEVRVLVALLAGLAVAVALGQLVRHILVGVTPHDPLALLLAGVVVAVVSLVAIAWPARRSAAVHPLEAFRAE
jgi:ABC-type antimicrobial peptide transport system permease subunit